MTINEITDLITGVGFPVACCIVLFIQNGKFQETLKEITLALQSLTKEIQDIEKQIEEIKD